MLELIEPRAHVIPAILAEKDAVYLHAVMARMHSLPATAFISVLV